MAHNKINRVFLIVLDSVGVGTLARRRRLRRRRGQHAGPRRRALRRAEAAQPAGTRAGEHPPRPGRRRRAGAAGLLGAHGRAVPRQGHHRRPLGDDGHRPGAAVRPFPAGFSRRAARRVPASGPGPPAFWATRPPRAPRSSPSSGAEHVRTGWPIVYTSADSVLQIAAHEEIIPLAELYEMCLRARTLCDALAHRPGDRPALHRRAGRFHAAPPTAAISPCCRRGRPSWTSCWRAGWHVTAIGKIENIFAGQGIGRSRPSHGNAEGMDLSAGGTGATAPRADLRQPGRFRHALRPPQRRRRLRRGPGGVRRASWARCWPKLGPGDLLIITRRPRLRSRLSRHRPHPGIRAAPGLRPGTAGRGPWARAPPSPTSAPPSWTSFGVDARFPGHELSGRNLVGART